VWTCGYRLGDGACALSPDPDDLVRLYPGGAAAGAAFRGPCGVSGFGAAPMR
jgi:hypothetical protein